jgi:hypothetical protein
MSALGRLVPPDFDHVLKYPLSDVKLATPVPAVLGINWYEGFDTPVLGTDGKYRIKISGKVRGGHCICVEPAGEPDREAWHVFYNQGPEDSCEGYGHSRAMSILTGRTFNAPWLYDDARRKEGTYPNGEGSTNRNACAALVSWGDHFEDGAHCVRTPWSRGVPGMEIPSYHWATHANEVLTALGLPSATEVALLNSWGTGYQQRVYLDVSDLQTLLTQEGECGVIPL